MAHENFAWAFWAKTTLWLNHWKETILAFVVYNLDQLIVEMQMKIEIMTKMLRNSRLTTKQIVVYWSTTNQIDNKWSSLQHNIPRSFCLVLVFWNLLQMIQLSICDVIVIIKKVLLEKGKQTHISWVGLNLSHCTLSYDICSAIFIY